MDRNAKRQIIREKSRYVKKQKKWNLLDEIQFRRILSMEKKEPVLLCRNIRPNVRTRLEVHGKKVNFYSTRTGEFCYQVSEK